MGLVMTTIALVGGKAVTKMLSTYAFDYLCKNSMAAVFLSNCASEVIDTCTSGIGSDKAEEKNPFEIFQNLLYQMINESIAEVDIPEDMLKWINIELFCDLNKIEIPPEKCLGDGLGDFLCEEFYKISSMSEDEVINRILVVFASKYRDCFFDIYSSRPKMTLQVIDEKFAAHDGKLADHARRISVLEESSGCSSEKANPEYIELYYQSLVEKIEKEEDSFLGKESLRDTYIPPRIKGGGDMKKKVHEWFRSTEYGVLLLYGQPGHGKTSFCRKMVYDYAVDNPKRATDAEVLQFPLNPAHSGIIVNNEINLENCMNDGSGDGSILLSLEECRGKLIFLDGFDELLNMMSEKTAVKSYGEFSKRIGKIARKYRIHFVVTSRINAVNPDDLNSSEAYEFAELSSDEQRDWCHEHNPRYWDTYLHNICEGDDSSQVNGDLHSLLKIPYIFRMVVSHEYMMKGTVRNRAALFSDLFDQTMGRTPRHFTEAELFELDNMNLMYQELAYKIWCDDCDSAIWDSDNKQLLLLAYYVKESDERGRLSFYHKSFYDYFLSLHFYNRMKESLREKKPDLFLEKLAERRLEKDILECIKELKTNDNEPINDSELKLILERIEESECIGIDTKDREAIKGNAERMRYERCNNIFVNALNLLFCFDVVQMFNKLVWTKKLMGKFTCSNLKTSYGSEILNLSKGIFIRANFGGADFSGADFGETNLSKAELYEVNFSEANLRRAELIEADLRGATFSGANLSGAYLGGAYLGRANLSKANFIGANLRGAALSGANLRGANLSGANISKTNLSGAVLIEADLKRADLKKADLIETDFRGADLRGADLIGADLKRAKLIGADLRGADFSGANLSGVDLIEADLRGADLRGADLKRVKLIGADLRGANLNETNLAGVDLRRAKLRVSDLKNITSSGVDLSGVIIVEEES